MRAFISQLILPLPVLLILFFLAIIQFRRGKQICSRKILSVAMVWLVLVSTPFFPNFLVRVLENRYAIISAEELQESDKQIHILVLGAGYSNDYRFPATNQLSEGALARLVEGIRLQRVIHGSILITSGWKAKEDISQAEVMANAALLLGIDSQNIKVQTEPKNTWMEATEYKRLFGDSTQLVLVTSAIHMPRAMYLFQKAGLYPIAAPTNHIIKKGKSRNPLYWMPNANNINNLKSSIHEYLGLLWYKLGGYSME